MFRGHSQEKEPGGRPAARKGSASLRSLQRLAWRDLKSSPGRSLPVFLIVLLSIGAYTAIQGTSGVFVQALKDQARAGLAADLSIEMYEGLTPAQAEALETLKAAGAQWTEVTSTVFLAAGPSGEPVAAVLKGVDPQLYPFYGALQLDPPRQFAPALADAALVISKDLARRLGAGPDDEITVNGLVRRVSAIVQYEPDRFAGNFSSSLRALIHRDAMQEWGVLDTGVPMLHRILVWLSPGMDLAVTQAELSSRFPGVEIFGVREINPVGADAVETASRALAMMAWLALAMGAAGVAMVARLHIEWRLDTLAALKCLGARPRDARMWLVLQLLMLGGAGGLVGALLGLVARRPLLWSAGLAAEIGDTGAAVLTSGGIAGALALGTAFGAALSVSMVLVSAISASELRPAPLMRRNTPEFRKSGEFRAMPWKWRIVSGSVFGMLAAAVLATQGQVVILFAALGIGLALFYQLTRVFLWFLGCVVPRQPGGARPEIRHGVRRLVRPELRSSTVVTAVALIALLATAVAVAQNIVAGEIMRSLPLGDANLYLMGFAHSQLEDVRYVLDRNSGIERPYGIFNLTWRRVSRGAHSAESRLHPMKMVSCRDDLAAGSGAIVGKDFARHLGVAPGSTLYLERDGNTLQTNVAAVRDVPPAERTWYSITVPCADVDPKTLFHGAGLVVDDSRFRTVWNDLQESFPAMGIATPDVAFEEISKVLRISVALIRFLSVATVMGGFVIVVGLIAATARQRAGEIAVYRVLGANRNTIVRVLSAEFTALGVAAGLIGGATGIVLANVGLSAALQRIVLDPHLSALAIAVLCGVVVAGAAGWVAARRFLAERPLVTLRRD